MDEKSSPFDGLRWSGDQPEVQIEETWYTPIAIDRVAVDKILVRCDQWSPGRIKRFAEDLVPVMQSLGWNGDAFVDLDLLALTDGSKVRIENVEMTPRKRQALLRQRRARESSGSRSSSSSSRISVKGAHSDVTAFGALLKDQFAYLGLGKVNLDDEISRIREGLSGEDVGINDLAQDLHKLLMRFGDGHARVESNRPQGQPGDKFLPFLLVESSAGVVAVLPDRSALVEAETPVVRAIDGRPLGDWVEAMKPFVAQGSPQLILRRSLGNLREIDRARRLLGLETSRPLNVTFATGDGSRTVQRELAASSNRPTYGTWPRPENSIPNALLEGNIGYLRIPKMNDDVELVHEAMRSFADTEGLVVDVRGNGGGTRALLLALGGYLIDPKKPAVVGNIAKYRLSQQFGEDHLEARYMYRADWSGWDKRQKSSIRKAKSKFKPEWKPVGKFSDWHYLVLDRTDYSGEYFYDKPVVIILDSGCFSATDIFLGALEILPRVTLVGTASSGGSARSQSFRLPKTGIEVRCASMASFRPDGRLYDGRGIEVDIEIPSDPTDFLINGSDVQLKAALAHLGVSHQESEEG